MDLFITTFEAVAVLLAIGLIGFLIIKQKVVPGRILSLISPLALDIALPSLVFVDIVLDFTPADYPNWWQLPLWWGFFTVVAFLLTFLFMFISKKDTRREFAVTLFYQNGIFFPLAILSNMFPGDQTYIVSLFLFTIFYPAFFFSTYQFFFDRGDKKKIDYKKIFHPVLIATLIGIAIGIIGINELVPDIVISVFSILGAMTIPLLMIILGGNIYVDYKKQGSFDFIEVSKFVLIKNIIFPLVFIGILILIKSYITNVVAIIILLQAAVPPVTAVPLVTERSGGNRSIVNQFMVASFIVSLISIPLMIGIFDSLF